MKQKKYDLLLIILILIAIVMAFGAMYYFHDGGDEVVVTIDGEEYGRYHLNENQTIQINTELGSNTLTIKDGKADMTDANCPDQICVKESPLDDDAPGTIVCLPHKLIVDIR